MPSAATFMRPTPRDTLRDSTNAIPAASVIAVAEFADLTQLATAGFAARFADPVGVGLGAFLALSSVSGCAVLLGSWLQRVVPLRLIQKAAAVLFVTIGVVTIVGAIS